MPLHFIEPKAKGKSSSSISYGRDNHFNRHVYDDVLY